MSEFDHLVAVVAGGASGVGLAAAKLLSQRGARVTVLDLEVDALPADLAGMRCDVTDRTSVEDVFNSLAEQEDGLDVLINSAGISAFGTVEHYDDTEWRRVLDINVTGVARVTAAALPLLRLSEVASVVNVSSVEATRGEPGRALYSATKGAVHALTLAMATDYIFEGIRVNCVSPGPVDFLFADRLVEDFLGPVAERAAHGIGQTIDRWVTPDEVASAIGFLASPLSGPVTGASLPVDGGASTLQLRHL